MVKFRFDPAVKISSSSKMYVVGDFTNWTVEEQFRMHFNQSDSLWKAKGLIKQGFYRYKYIRLKNGRITEIGHYQKLTGKPRYFITFIYYRDPELHYDRLLKFEGPVN